MPPSTAVRLLVVGASLVGVASATLRCGARSDLEVDEASVSGMGGATHSSSSGSGAGGSGSSGGAGGSDPCDGPEICNGIDDDCDGQVDEDCQPPVAGCSDGTREGFLDDSFYLDIAACSGGWSVPGVITTSGPMCNHQSGNDSSNPGGQGCSVADLCEPGWHVCEGEQEVASHSPDGCNGASMLPDLFFATRRSSNGCGNCANGNNTNPSVCDGCTCAGGCAQTVLTANDLFGCGSLGSQAFSCGILNRFSNNLCDDLGPPWSCPGNGCDEANNVTKSSSDGGGVLCCRD